MITTEWNYRMYEDPEVVGRYVRDWDLYPAEKSMLRKVTRDAPAQRLKILDVGCGGGRTVGPLSQLGDYVGIDYSAAMVREARDRFPDHLILEGDVRKLEFPDNSFDLVVFSFNGLDTLTADDREVALEELRRVLKVGGALMMSSHNRDHRRPLGRVVKDTLLLLLDPDVRARRTLLRGGEVRSSEYEIRNDPAHDYRMLVYRISADSQVKQLERHGFAPAEVYEKDGLRLHDPRGGRSSSWLNYLSWRLR